VDPEPEPLSPGFSLESLQYAVLGSVSAIPPSKPVAHELPVHGFSIDVHVRDNPAVPVFRNLFDLHDVSKNHVRRKLFGPFPEILSQFWGIDSIEPNPYWHTPAQNLKRVSIGNANAPA
jgi:hypothetical protein